MAPHITLVRAPSATGLAERLVERLAETRKGCGPLAPIELLVPHRAMAEWLTVELTARTGGVANLRFLTPAQLLAENGRTSGALTAAVFKLLDESTLAAPDFAAVRGYVERGDAADDRRSLRRYELARRVASTFAQYSAHLPGGPSLAKDGGQTAVWQQLLWERLPAPVASSTSSTAGAPIFVFDVAVPGADLVDIVRDRSDSVHVFARTSPSDSTSDRWHRHGRLFSTGLQRWLAAGATLEANDSPTGAMAPVPRVQRLDAPTVRRGLEAVAARIWDWVREETASPRVRFHEIAVVVPDQVREQLLPVLREVFDEAHELPKVLWRSPLGTNNRVVALARKLVELPSTPMRRAELVEVLTHPHLAGAFDEDLPESWTDWVDAVGIFHGLDGASHAGTYLEDAAAADWDQGLSRLALGAFLGSERSGEASSLQTTRGTLMAEELSQSAAPAAGRFLQLVRSLLCDAEFLRRARLPASEWRGLMAAYLATYVRPAGTEDLEVRSAVLSALEVFGRCPLDGLLPWDVARVMALGALDAIQADVGAHLTQGVVVGSPSELRGLPFRRLVFLGLEQGSFPAKSVLSELDLRTDDETGRPDDPRRADALAFYDLVTSTEGEVCLVSTSLDPLTGERREPSLLVRDLEEHIKARIQAPHANVMTLPQHRRAQVDNAFNWAFPETAVERAAHEAGETLAPKGRRFPGHGALPENWRRGVGLRPLPELPGTGDDIIEVPLSRLIRFLEYPTRGYAEQRLGYRADHEERDDLIDEPFETPFLVSISVKQEVLYDLAREATPNDWTDEVTLSKKLESAYDKTIEQRRLRGNIPEGFFFDLQRERDLTELASTCELLRTRSEFRPPYRTLRWGRPDSFADRAAERHDPVELRVKVRGVERTVLITGNGQLLSDDGSALFRFKSSIKTRPDWFMIGLRLKHGLSPWVEHLMLQAAGDRRARVAYGQGRVDAVVHAFSDVSPHEARSQLTGLLEGLLDGRVGFRCPSVAMFQGWHELAPGTPWPARRKSLLANEYGLFGRFGADHERYSPVRRVETLRLPTEHEFDRVYRRVEPYALEQLACIAAEAAAEEARKADEAALKAAAKALKEQTAAKMKTEKKAAKGGSKARPDTDTPATAAEAPPTLARRKAATSAALPMDAVPPSPKRKPTPRKRKSVDSSEGEAS